MVMAPGSGVAGAEGADSPSNALTPGSVDAASPSSSAAAAGEPGSSDVSRGISTPSAVAVLAYISFLAMAA